MRKAVFGLASLMTVIAACKSTPGEAIRPKDPTYNEANGTDKAEPAVCHEPNADGSALVVDWKPEERADLEAAIKAGVAVVHYDCNSMKLLPDCHPKTKLPYGYIGVTKNEQVISITNADEAKANLPLNGGSIGAKIGRGSALDVALVMVGKSTAPVTKVSKSDLGDRCEGATHFIRSATLGAFAMKTRTGGQAAAAAQMFGVGASGSSTSDKGTGSSVGDLDACQKADSDATLPAKNCGAPLRVQLLALDASVSEKAAAVEVSCPKGMVATAGKCVAATAPAAPKDCDGENLDDCTKQCAAGSVSSCLDQTRLSLLAGLNANSTKYDALSLQGEEKGCALGSMFSCYQLGDSYETGALGTKDLAKAQKWYLHACSHGGPEGCRALGKMISSPTDKAKVWNRGCLLADGESCRFLGEAFERGTGVAKDATTAKTLFQKACGLHDKTSCAKAR